MSIIIGSEKVREILSEEMPGLGETTVARIVHRMSLASGAFTEVDYRGQIGADLMVNCADVCIVGELHSSNKRMRIFVET
jgi:hypothetical protein